MTESAATRPGDDGRRLRVLFVTEDDPLYVVHFFDTFFSHYPRDEFEICAITIDNAFHEPLTKTARRLWRVYGPLGFVRLGFRFLGARLRGRSIGALARKAGVKEMPTDSVNDPEYVRRVRGMEVDVIVSVAAPEIFRKDILESAKMRCINIHSGRLPKYRGMMPTFWQLLHGEKQATVTVHEMAVKLDAGDVLGTADFDLKERDRLDRVIVETKRLGARLMIDVLRQIAAGTDQPQALDMSRKEYFSFPKKADAKAFRQRGHRML
ncbi:MAG: formyltransferase family protein [Planctomycetota bacterium]|nr:formyltransferase family protein [Planctomycetota bacterium]